MTRDERLVEILGDWLERRDSGVPMDVAGIAAANPDLADELRRQLDLVDAVVASARQPDTSDEPRLGGYRILREIGSGGMGTVFLGERRDGSRVALKVLHPHLLERPGFFKRFLREADLGRRVRHANVVRTLDFDAVLQDGRAHHYLVMEYVEGKTLRRLLQEIGHVPEELCRHIAREVCAGLAAIHAEGAVHRDLKPDNVLITVGDHVKLMDLGVVRVVDDSARLSQTGAFVGSVGYAAPEQLLDGARVDARADLHALGLLLYEAASGVYPFAGDHVAHVIERVLHDEPRRLGDVGPPVGPFLEGLVHTLLAKHPDDRFGSAAALLAVLEEGEASAWWRDRAAAGGAAPRDAD